MRVADSFPSASSATRARVRLRRGHRAVASCASSETTVSCAIWSYPWKCERLHPFPQDAGQAGAHGPRKPTAALSAKAKAEAVTAAEGALVSALAALDAGTQVAVASGAVSASLLSRATHRAVRRPARVGDNVPTALAAGPRTTASVTTWVSSPASVSSHAW